MSALVTPPAGSKTDRNNTNRDNGTAKPAKPGAHGSGPVGELSRLKASPSTSSGQHLLHPREDDPSGSDDGCGHCCHHCNCHPWVSRMLYRARRSSMRTCGLTLFIVLYMVLGAVVFMALEAPVERQLMAKVETVREKFLTDHNCMTGRECILHLDSRNVFFYISNEHSLHDGACSIYPYFILRDEYIMQCQKSEHQILQNLNSNN